MVVFSDWSIARWFREVLVSCDCVKKAEYGVDCQQGVNRNEHQFEQILLFTIEWSHPVEWIKWMI